jgi:predicted nucleotidyltransferase
MWSTTAYQILTILRPKSWFMSKTIDWSRTQAVWAAAPGVIAAWAFGSAQHGLVNPGSDIDIGVLFTVKPSLDEQLDLAAHLQQALPAAEVDLVVLNEANPILCFEAISGRLLFCRDAGRRAAFASLTAREYEDAMAFWQRGLAYQNSAAGL